jgi:hypothetical protein
MPTEAQAGRMLTEELLLEYERRLRTLGVSVDGAFNSGLGDGEMAAAVDALPLELSAEARVWWRWRDGVRPDAPPGSGHIAPGTHLLSLERAVRAYRENRLLAAEIDPENPDRWWNPQWLPLLSPDNGTTIGCDCSVTGGEPSPLHVVWWEDPDEGAPRRAAGSLGQMVVWWLEAIDAGVWGYDRDSRRWTRDWQGVPPERSGLV